MWVSFVVVCFGGQKAAHTACACVWNLAFWKNTLPSADQKSSLLVLNITWEQNFFSNPRSFALFEAASQLRIWPQHRVKCGLDPLKKEKVLPSAFVSTNGQLCFVLYHFVLPFPCHLVGQALCWIEDKECLSSTPFALSSLSLTVLERKPECWDRTSWFAL